MNITFEQKKNFKAWGITIGAHLLLFLFFLLFKYSMPAETVPEPLGLEVNLGTSDNGFGTDQPEAMGSPSSETQHNSTHSSNGMSSNVALNGLVTSNDNQAPGVDIRDKEKNKNNNSDNTNNTRTRRETNSAVANQSQRTVVRKPLYTYQGSTGNGQGNEAMANHPGGNEGIGTGNGDMGAPGGTPGASNYKGIPSGTGFVSALVGNRYMVEVPDKEAHYDNGGRVVINVTVNRQGIIINHTVVSATNATIRAIALRKLKSVKFNKAPDASPEMFGPITFHFNTR